jgi:hypothetical protein
MSQDRDKIARGVYVGDISKDREDRREKEKAAT